MFKYLNTTISEFEIYSNNIIIKLDTHINIPDDNWNNIKIKVTFIDNKVMQIEDIITKEIYSII